MFLLAFAALIGGVITFAALWPYGFLLALVATPFGGSILALLAGLALAFQRTSGTDPARDSDGRPQMSLSFATDRGESRPGQGRDQVADTGCQQPLRDRSRVPAA